MFIQPNGRVRRARDRGGKATGLILAGFGVLSFLCVIQQYTQRVMPSVLMAQAASEYYGYNGGHAGLILASNVDEHKIQNVILAQFSAIKHKDFVDALRYSSINAPNANARGFEDFLETRYPENAAPKSIQFPDTAMLYVQTYAFQRVAITGKDGVTVQELYLMVATDSGWRVRHFRVIGGDASGPGNINPWSAGR